MGKQITIGVAGHVDHGKTALVGCLTGIDTDRAPEEKQGKLSIESGVAPLSLSSGGIAALIDVPGHTDFLKNTVRGLNSVDMAILVIAADDGVMPQTREHLEVLNFFQAKGGFTVLSKVDLVDDETIELARLEINELLSGTFLEKKPVLSFSAIDQRGIDDIKSIVEKEVKHILSKNNESPFRLWIDQVKSISGFGVIVTGTVSSGTITQDDPIELLPSGIKTRARFLESHGKRTRQGYAGQRIGVNLHKVHLKDIKRGMALSKPKTLNITYLINVDLRILKKADKPVRDRQRLKLFIGTSIINAKLILMDKKQLAPGESGLAQFRLMKPVALLPKDPFVVSLLNINTIIGGGLVLEIPQEKFKDNRASKIMPCLKALQIGDLKIFCDCVFSINPKRFVTAQKLAHTTGFSLQELEKEISSRIKKGELIYFSGEGAYNKKHFEMLKNRIFKAAKCTIKQNSLKNTRTSEILSASGLSMSESMFQKILEALCDEGKLIRTVRGFQIQNLSVTLSREQEKLSEILLDFAIHSGFVPFSAGYFFKLYRNEYKKDDVERLLDYLCRQNRLIRLNNRHYLTSQYMERIKKKIKHAIVEKGRLTIKDSQKILGYGRNKAIPVLEYLDDIGITQREGDVRILKTKI